MEVSFEFSNTWFESARPIWDRLIPQIAPTRILEVGSYEGASACYLIRNLGTNKSIELHCVDTWEGGTEHRSGGTFQTNMSAVETRFHKNIALAIKSSVEKPVLTIHKGRSDIELSKLLASGKAGYFDFIYIDGSHQAPDVLCDAILAFRLLRTGGLIAFDDYLWRENAAQGSELLRCPKAGIDAFTNIYFQKIRVLNAPLRQLYIQKTSD